MKIPALSKRVAVVANFALLFYSTIRKRLQVVTPDGQVLDVEHTARQGMAGGYPSLNGNGYVYTAQLGSGAAGAGAKFLADDYTWKAGGGGGTLDHAALTSNLAWDTSGHTLAADRLAGSDGAGAAVAASVAAPLAYSSSALSLSGWSGTTDGDLLYRNGTAVGTKTPAQARTWLDLATYYQPLDADLTALAALATTGLVARTGAGAVAARTLTAPAAGITVSNGDGVSGNPTLSLANDLAALEGLSSTGIAVRTATDTWAQRSLVAGDGITITNGDGAAGNPTVAAAVGTFSSPAKKLYWYWSSTRATIITNGPSTSLPGVADGVTDTYNSTLCQSTSSSAHSGPNCATLTRLGHEGVMEITIRTASTNTNRRLKVGYYTGTHAGSPDTPTTGGYYMLFRASTAIPDTNWQIVHGTGTASAYTTTDTGIAWSNDTTYTFRIETTSSGVTYTVTNENTAATYSTTITANLPAAGTNIGWTAVCTSVSGTTNLGFLGAYYEADHPT